MKTRMVEVREGENVGPVDWSHPIAKDMPPIWREAEKDPASFVFGEYRRTILDICMYDGWPYWQPTPAICYVGPLKSAEWTFFNSYGVHPNSILSARPDAGSEETK
jgi:hypothetical protein